MRYWFLGTFLRTVGQLSEGVRLGWRRGFDSGMMIEYIYQNHPRGISPLGVAVDRAILNHSISVGVRSRRALLVDQLRAAVNQYEKPVVFDLAAGMGSYLFMIPRGRAMIVAGDYDKESVVLGVARTRDAHRPDIRFMRNNAFVLEQMALHDADILVTSGFFDILTSDDEIRAVLRNGSEITKPGARWVFTVQEKHPDLRLFREALVNAHKRPWELVPRRAEVVADWASGHGWRIETLQRNEFFAVGTLYRTS
ncbi:MAG: class I SAM-dependent methyltransferase family protein [Bryobacteraceae bacterium]